VSRTARTTFIDEGIVKTDVGFQRGRWEQVLGHPEARDISSGELLSVQSVYLTSRWVVSGQHVEHYQMRERRFCGWLEERPFRVDDVHELLVAAKLRMEQNLIIIFLPRERGWRERCCCWLDPFRAEIACYFRHDSNQDTLAGLWERPESRINFFMNKFRTQGHIHYTGD